MDLPGFLGACPCFIASMFSVEDSLFPRFPVSLHQFSLFFVPCPKLRR